MKVFEEGKVNRNVNCNVKIMFAVKVKTWK